MKDHVQRYNVLCVTKDFRVVKPYSDPHWHALITGVAEVVTSHEECFGVKIVRTKVRFQGHENLLLGVRTGLGGSAVVLMIDMIDRIDNTHYDMWQLYTDTPADGTPVERIREIALGCIENGYRRRGYYY